MSIYNEVSSRYEIELESEDSIALIYTTDEHLVVDIFDKDNNIIDTTWLTGGELGFRVN